MNLKKTDDITQHAKDILNEPKFINQSGEGVRFLIDEDARVGCKSKTQDFFGYKTEFTMTAAKRIIIKKRWRQRRIKKFTVYPLHGVCAKKVQ